MSKFQTTKKIENQDTNFFEHPKMLGSKFENSDYDFKICKNKYKKNKNNKKCDCFASRPVPLFYFLPSSYVINQYTAL